MVLFFLDRIDHLDAVAKLPRKPSEYMRNNVFVNPSGVLSTRELRWAIEVLGADRILFATDHPFVSLPPGSVGQSLEDPGLTAAERLMVGRPAGNAYGLKSAGDSAERTSVGSG
jgi:hypothetical protein